MRSSSLFSLLSFLFTGSVSGSILSQECGFESARLSLEVSLSVNEAMWLQVPLRLRYGSQLKIRDAGIGLFSEIFETEMRF